MNDIDERHVTKLPLHLIVPHPNFPAGMNPLVIMAVAHTLRNGADHGYGPCQTAPIHVSREPATGLYRIEDGRHRWAAHWVAGYERARCVIVDDLP